MFGKCLLFLAVVRTCLLALLCQNLFLNRELSNVGKDLKKSVFLEALAQREEANRNGKMTVSNFSLFCCFSSCLEIYWYCLSEFKLLRKKRPSL